MNPVADEFAAIARRLREIKGEPEPAPLPVQSELKYPAGKHTPPASPVLGDNTADDEYLMGGYGFYIV